MLSHVRAARCEDANTGKFARYSTTFLFHIYRHVSKEKDLPKGVRLNQRTWLAKIGLILDWCKFGNQTEKELHIRRATRVPYRGPFPNL
jgi:hypothetical protein